jgi:hypothetical protein
MRNKLPSKHVRDEYKEYVDGDSISYKPDSIYKWWQQQHAFPGICQMAYDYLSIPVISFENERNFSDAKLMLPDNRRRLGDNQVEVLSKGMMMSVC